MRLELPSANADVQVFYGRTLTPDEAGYDPGNPDTVKYTGWTWTKPTGAAMVQVTCIGGGGGGGAGYRGDPTGVYREDPGGTNLGGGQGGDGGQWSMFSFPGALVDDTVQVNTGAGGGGGQAGVDDDEWGYPGDMGGTTLFGSYLQAGGGNGGSGGGPNPEIPTMTDQYGFGFLNSMVVNGLGAHSGTGGPVDPPGCPGGGGGGFIVAGGVPDDSFNWGAVSRVFGLGLAVASTSGADGAGYVGGLPGPGGSGAGGQSRDTGGDAGGDGGRFGAGGGGGGAAVDGTPSGAGGRGGDGVCVVVVFF